MSIASAIKRNTRLTPTQRLARKTQQARWYQENYAKNPEVAAKGRIRRIKAKFGATPQDIVEQLVLQNNCCAICLELLKQGQHRHIDHDHSKPGTFRGILCIRCNTGLGKFKDSYDTLLRAAAYVRDGARSNVVNRST